MIRFYTRNNREVVINKNLIATIYEILPNENPVIPDGYIVSLVSGDFWVVTKETGKEIIEDLLNESGDSWKTSFRS